MADKTKVKRYSEEIRYTEGLLLSKINNGKLLTEDELKYMCKNFSIEENLLEENKVASTCKLKDRYFIVNWRNTNWDDNDYNEQPYEVVKREVVEISISKTSGYIRRGEDNIKTSDEVLKELSDIINDDYKLDKGENDTRLFIIDKPKC